MSTIKPLFEVKEYAVIRYEKKKFIVTDVTALMTQSNISDTMHFRYIRPNGHGLNVSNEGIYLNSATLVELIKF
jgi:hypothetical protein